MAGLEPAVYCSQGRYVSFTPHPGDVKNLCFTQIKPYEKTAALARDYVFSDGDNKHRQY